MRDCTNCFYDAIAVVLGGEKISPPACQECWDGKEYTNWVPNKKVGVK